jgi:small nuclear ribonucleoprotein (snRNP)-like protein
MMIANSQQVGSLFKIMTITGLIALTGLVGNALAVQSRPVLTVAQGTKAGSQIPVFLPDDVKVKLKGGASLSGRVTNFDSKAKKVTITNGSDSQSVAIKDIDVVLFQGKVILRNNNAIVIRGDDSQKSPNQNGKTFKEPLRNFQIVDATKGEARVTITSPLELKGVQAVAQNSSYVVEQIRFDSSDKIQIRVTPR